MSVQSLRKEKPTRDDKSITSSRLTTNDMEILRAKNNDLKQHIIAMSHNQNMMMDMMKQMQGEMNMMKGQLNWLME